MGRFAELGHDLYEGKVSYDFVGRRRLWYTISVLIVVVAVGGLVGRGLNLGLEFEGGSEFTISAEATQDNVDMFSEAASESGVEVGQVAATTSGDDKVIVQTQPLTQDEADQVQAAFETAGASEVSQQSIGATWGAQILDRALLALGVFLFLVVLFIWAYFREWKMSVAAIVALAHDVMITVGVYAIVGFEVTPASVTGLLTILGYSLYDTVVVFDKVRENTRAFTTNTRSTYSELANLAVNQTLVRSINTSITALLPVAALLFVGVVVVGSGPLKDLALALFVGMAAGTYSSIFIATPLAAQLKERDPAVKAQAKRVLARRQRGNAKSSAASAGSTEGPAGSDADAGAGSAGGEPETVPSGAGTEPPRPRHAPQPAAAIGAALGPPTATPAPTALTTREGTPMTTPVDAALDRLVRDVADFPQAGVVFKDITPLLADPEGFATIVTGLADLGRRLAPDGVDCVVGVEARGFILAAPVALALGAGFVPVRKKGKLPGETHEVSFLLEYGEATLQVHRDAFTPGARVLVVDDVLATGGTVQATKELVDRCGAQLLGVAVLLELAFLDARAKLSDVNLGSLRVVD